MVENLIEHASKGLIVVYLVSVGIHGFIVIDNGEPVYNRLLNMMLGVVPRIGWYPRVYRCFMSYIVKQFMEPR